MFLMPYNKRNSVSAYNPFRAMEELERQFFGGNGEAAAAFSTDIHDTGKEYVLEADLPGFKKSDISIDIEDGCMTISAERRSEYEEKDKKGGCIRSERSFGRFARSFDTTGIDVDKIKATFKDGVLTMKLPKLSENRPAPKKLEIE